MTSQITSLTLATTLEYTNTIIFFYENDGQWYEYVQSYSDYEIAIPSGTVQVQ